MRIRSDNAGILIREFWFSGENGSVAHSVETRLREYHVAARVSVGIDSRAPYRSFPWSGSETEQLS